mmetsp:Transcript_12197/g.28785  ORF Transcript_12197/g.28785 Transcript_12197/m.28785 type:complete len:212 (-) Transcript_12197:105-740(-)
MCSSESQLVEMALHKPQPGLALTLNRLPEHRQFVCRSYALPPTAHVLEQGGGWWSRGGWRMGRDGLQLVECARERLPRLRSMRPEKANGRRCGSLAFAALAHARPHPHPRARSRLRPRPRPRPCPRPRPLRRGTPPSQLPSYTRRSVRGSHQSDGCLHPRGGGAAARAGRVGKLAAAHAHCSGANCLASPRLRFLRYLKKILLFMGPLVRH